MKIGNSLRDLVMRQPETHMLSQTRCNYIGELYEFEAVTGAEIENMRLNILKNLDKKSYLKEVLRKVFGNAA